MTERRIAAVQAVVDQNILRAALINACSLAALTVNVPGLIGHENGEALFLSVDVDGETEEYSIDQLKIDSVVGVSAVLLVREHFTGDDDDYWSDEHLVFRLVGDTYEASRSILLENSRFSLEQCLAII